MSRGVPGTTCRIRIEWAGPPWPDDLADMVGDFLRTDAGSCYRIDEFRPARPSSASLGTFVCIRLEHDAVEDGQDGVWTVAWAKRERRR